MTGENENDTGFVITADKLVNKRDMRLRLQLGSQ